MNTKPDTRLSKIYSFRLSVHDGDLLENLLKASGETDRADLVRRLIRAEAESRGLIMITPTSVRREKRAA